MRDRVNTHPHLLLAVLVAAAALLLLSFAGPATASGPVSERAGDAAAAVREYWTAARMRAADPIEPPEGAETLPPPGAARAPAPAAATYVPSAGPAALVEPQILAGSPEPRERVVPGATRDEILDPSEPAFRPHGKVFFTIPEGEAAGDYVCSATAVNSRNQSVVWTAGHCVFPEGGKDFVTNWTFVPAYREGSAPFGEWPAKRLSTTGPWEAAANIKYDLGAAVVGTNGVGAKLQTVVGARGIGFDQPRDQVYEAFGYPAVQPPLEFTGEREFRCTSPFDGNDEPGTAGPPTMRIECDMTGGSSGGGWIVGSTLLSVTSYGYPLELDRLYGPYMSASAKALYKSVRGKGKPKPKGSRGPRGKGTRGKD